MEDLKHSHTKNNVIDIFGKIKSIRRSKSISRDVEALLAEELTKSINEQILKNLKSSGLLSGE